MRRTSIASILLSTTLAATACGGAPDGTLEEAPESTAPAPAFEHIQSLEVAQTTQALASNTQVVFAPNSQSASTPLNFDVTRGLCVLSQVTGDFTFNTGAGVSQVLVQPDGTYMGLGEGRAVCVPWTNFLAPTGSIAAVSGEYQAVVVGSGAQSVPMGLGNTFSFLGGPVGMMANLSDWIGVLQSTNPSGPSTLSAVTAAVVTFLGASGRSVFVGNPNNTPRLVKLAGYSPAGAPAIGNVTAGGTFKWSVSTESGVSSVLMARSNAGVCAFTNVTGAFVDTNDSALISEAADAAGTRWWRLSVKKGRGKVKASARCFAYDQR